MARPESNSRSSSDAANSNPASSPSEQTEAWTVGRLLTWTADFLKRKSSESPRLDAEVLLAKVLGWERVKLYTHFNEEIGDRPRGAFRELVKQRAEGTPVAYLVGYKEFYSLTLAVSPAVLIPRPDSEFVVVEFLKLTRQREQIKAVDVGTGSGCLTLACLHQHKSAQFFAIDLSTEALGVAETNAKTLGLSERVTFRQGNLLEPVREDGPFDVILSNPPYIRSDVIPTLDPGVRLYEPHGALDGGEDGLRVVTPLVQQAIHLLKPGGHLILEIGSDQESQVRELISTQPEFDLAPTVRDHANHPRVIWATRR